MTPSKYKKATHTAHEYVIILFEANTHIYTHTHSITISNIVYPVDISLLSIIILFYHFKSRRFFQTKLQCATCVLISTTVIRLIWKASQ